MPVMKGRLPLVIFSLFFLAVQGFHHAGKKEKLLVICSRSDFGMYTPEILRAEGITCFDTVSLLNAGTVLNRYHAVILSSARGDKALYESLYKYVRKGGKLIAVITPYDAPEELFGRLMPYSTRRHSYVSIDTASETGKHLSGHPLQVHSESALRLPYDCMVLAWFVNHAGKEKSGPAVITKRIGKGTLTAFLYNLPANIALTRQGNPTVAGIEEDGIPGLRAMDLFTGGWVDTDCNTINQADEQMHLLSQIIESTAFPDLPLPRIGYFPDTLKCLVTLTNDGEFRNENDFEAQFRDIDSAGATMSLYVMETGGVSREWARRWTGRGFEIAGHPDNTKEAGAPVWAHADSVLACKIKDISALYGLDMKTVVNHWFVWCGTDATGKQEFSAQAQIEANRGILLDANYAHYDNNSSSGHFLGIMGAGQGNFTGSGLPMRFISSTGQVAGIWQHLNNVYDQQYNENHDPDGFFMAFRGLMDRSIDNDIWSYISIKSHNDEYYFTRTHLLKMISYAKSRGTPVWTAARLADFLVRRNSAVISGLRFRNDKLSFSFETVPHSRDNPSIMIPSAFNGKLIKQIKVNGRAERLVGKNLRGRNFVFLVFPEGGRAVVSADYVKPD